MQDESHVKIKKKIRGMVLEPTRGVGGGVTRLIEIIRFFTDKARMHRLVHRYTRSDPPNDHNPGKSRLIDD